MSPSVLECEFEAESCVTRATTMMKMTATVYWLVMVVAVVVEWSSCKVIIQQ